VGAPGRQAGYYSHCVLLNHNGHTHRALRRRHRAAQGGLVLHTLMLILLCIALYLPVANLNPPEMHLPTKFQVPNDVADGDGGCFGTENTGVLPCAYPSRTRAWTCTSSSPW